MNQDTLGRPNIFNYSCIQSFISDTSLYLKLSKKVSRNAIAKRANFGSMSYLKMIIDGQRNLSPKSAELLGKALELGRDEIKFFLLLLQLQLEDTESGRQKIEEKMADFRKYYEMKQVDQDYEELFSKWFYTVVLEFIGTARESWTEKELAASLEISLDEIQQSIQLLHRLKLIEPEKGSWKRSSANIQTTKQISSETIEKFTEQMLHQAVDHLKEQDLDKRNYQALTVSLNRHQYKKLTEQIWNFMTEVNKDTNNIDDPDAIYQLNVQLFSLLELKKAQ